MYRNAETKSVSPKKIVTNEKTNTKHFYPHLLKYWL